MMGSGDRRFCQGCKKPVVDFSAKGVAALEAAHRAARDGEVCGRFSEDQLSREPWLLATAQMHLLKMRRFLACLIISFGTALFNGLPAQTVDSVKVASFSTVRVTARSDTAEADSTGWSGTIEGRTLTSAGDSIPFAFIKLFRDNILVGTYLSDERGRYKADSLEPAVYAIEASLLGSSAYSDRLLVTANDTISRDMYLVPVAVCEGSRIRTTVGLIVQGAVLRTEYENPSPNLLLRYLFGGTLDW
jgi:hypothetical protein